MEDNKRPSLSDIIGEKYHSDMLLGGLSRTPLNRGVERAYKQLAESLKAKFEATPDFSNVPFDDLTPEQVQALMDRGNAIARLNNILDEP